MEKETNEFVSYLFQTQTHIHENIKFADQKAAAFITLNSGVVGALYAGNLFLPRGADPAVVKSSFLAFSFLLISIGLFGVVLWPYGVGLQEKLDPEWSDLAVPEKITDNRKDAFIRIFVPEDGSTPKLDDRLTGNLCAFVHTRSEINNRKYEWLKYSIKVAYVGWFTAVLLVLLARLLTPNAASSQQAVNLDIADWWIPTPSPQAVNFDMADGWIPWPKPPKSPKSPSHNNHRHHSNHSARPATFTRPKGKPTTGHQPGNADGSLERSLRPA
jgi:hypothetical protein